MMGFKLPSFSFIIHRSQICTEDDLYYSQLHHKWLIKHVSVHVGHRKRYVHNDIKLPMLLLILNQFLKRCLPPWATGTQLCMSSLLYISFLSGWWVPIITFTVTIIKPPSSSKSPSWCQVAILALVKLPSRCPQPLQVSFLTN